MKRISLFVLVSFFATLATATTPQATPATKAFAKALWNRIGHAWFAQVETRCKGAHPGTTHIKFLVSATGNVEQVKIVSNTSGKRAAKFALECVRRANGLKPPAEALENGVFAADVIFILTPPRPNQALQPTATRFVNLAKHD